MQLHLCYLNLLSNEVLECGHLQLQVFVTKLFPIVGPDDMA